MATSTVGQAGTGYYNNSGWVAGGSSVNDPSYASLTAQGKTFGVGGNNGVVANAGPQGTNSTQTVQGSGSVGTQVSSANKVSTAKTSAPVINATMAQNDYTAKYNALNSLINSMQQQAGQKASQQQLAQANQLTKDLQASEANLKQQGIDVEKTRAQAALTAAEAKKQATSALTSSSQGTPPAGWDAQTYANF